MTNRERAAAAKKALDAFTEACYGGRTTDELHADDVHTAASDLVADLGHFLRLYSEEKPVEDKSAFDIESCFNQGMHHYDAEAARGWDEEE